MELAETPTLGLTTVASIQCMSLIKLLR